MYAELKVLKVSTTNFLSSHLSYVEVSPDMFFFQILWHPFHKMFWPIYNTSSALLTDIFFERTLNFFSLHFVRATSDYSRWFRLDTNNWLLHGRVWPFMGDYIFSIFSLIILLSTKTQLNGRRWLMYNHYRLCSKLEISPHEKSTHAAIL